MTETTNTAPTPDADTQRNQALEQLADIFVCNDITPPSSLHAIAECLLDNCAEIGKIFRLYQNSLDSQPENGDYGDENYRWRKGVVG